MICLKFFFNIFNKILKRNILKCLNLLKKYLILFKLIFIFILNDLLFFSKKIREIV
jgi:hypothetical protein